MQHPEPTRAAALARIDALDLARYERTRNALDGHVSQLSPYLTHGVVTVAEVIGRIGARAKLGWDDKFAFELGWREYFQHVWRMLGDAIWQSPRHAPAAQYLDAMPPDVLNATTGVAIIDASIHALYQTGYVHNHARMWLASYVVHVRKVDWRCGATWMYPHLLDGDLAANTLSWQWVAGTWTGKPYIFNAENVAKYAPGLDHRGTAIDVSYAEMDCIARSTEPLIEAAAQRDRVTPYEPPVTVAPAGIADLVQQMGFRILQKLPEDFDGELMHPWALGARDPTRHGIGLLLSDFHAQFPWNVARWQFVLRAMRESCDSIYLASAGDGAAISKVSIRATYNPVYQKFIECVRLRGGEVSALPAAFVDPSTLQRSFSSFWHRAMKEKFPS